MKQFIFLIKMEKDTLYTLDNYITNLYENEEQIDDKYKFACIY